MITPAEALELPAARLSPSDAEASAAYLRDIEEFIRKNMTRVGCVMPADPRRLNPAIACEIERALRKAGWRAEFQTRTMPSTLTPGQAVQVHQLAMAPPDSAYDEVDAKRARQAGN